MGTDMKRTGNVFRNRNYRLVFFGALVSELGALLYSFAVGFYILEITENNAFLQGLYLALCGVSLLVFTPVGGVLGDNFNKAKIMYVCDYVKGGLILLATALLQLFPQNNAQLVILFAAGILGNGVSGIFTPASGALLPHIVEEEKLQQANAYFSMKSSLESILGIILAAILYASMPITLLFLVVGICYLASGVSEMLIRFEHHKPHERLTLKLAVRDMGEGISYLKTKKAILALLGAILFINFFFAPVTGNFLPYFVKTDLASAPSYLLDQLLTPELWSSVFTVCCGLSALLGAAILSARAQEEKCGAKTAHRLCATAALMIGFTVCFWLLVDRGVSLNGFLIAFCLFFLVLGALLSFINIPINTALMRVVDKDKLSKVNSIISIGSQGMIPIASVLAGAILETLGSTLLLSFCALGFTVTALLLLFNKQIREL
ncbi:MAG: MFS transporter [Oscillospiraceae bacterium]|nr:MFS transporter [Oscillospiraceae bacterium]